MDLVIYMFIIARGQFVRVLCHSVIMDIISVIIYFFTSPSALILVLWMRSCIQDAVDKEQLIIT